MKNRFQIRDSRLIEKGAFGKIVNVWEKLKGT